MLKKLLGLNKKEIKVENENLREIIIDLNATLYDADLVLNYGLQFDVNINAETILKCIENNFTVTIFSSEYYILNNEGDYTLDGNRFIYKKQGKVEIILDFNEYIIYKGEILQTKIPFIVSSIILESIEDSDIKYLSCYKNIDYFKGKKLCIISNTDYLKSQFDRKEIDYRIIDGSYLNISNESYFYIEDLFFKTEVFPTISKVYNKMFMTNFKYKDFNLKLFPVYPYIYVINEMKYESPCVFNNILNFYEPIYDSVTDMKYDDNYIIQDKCVENVDYSKNIQNFDYYMGIKCTDSVFYFDTKPDVITINEGNLICLVSNRSVVDLKILKIENKKVYFGNYNKNYIYYSYEDNKFHPLGEYKFPQLFLDLEYIPLIKHCKNVDFLQNLKSDSNYLNGYLNQILNYEYIVKIFEGEPQYISSYCKSCFNLTNSNSSSILKTKFPIKDPNYFINLIYNNNLKLLFTIDFNSIFFLEKNKFDFSGFLCYSDKFVRFYGFGYFEKCKSIIRSAFFLNNIIYPLAWSLSDIPLENDKNLTFAFDSSDNSYKFLKDVKLSNIKNLLDMNFYEPENK